MHEAKHAQTELDWAGGSHPAGGRASGVHLRGAIGFSSPEAQVQRTAELLGDGALVVSVPPLPATMRGHLAEHVEEHLEHELARSGAPSAYLAAWSAMPDDADERLADQLFRARSVGCSGIAIVMGSIAAAACPTLTPDDSATLRWLAKATAHAPLVVLLDDADLVTSGFDAPVPLGQLLGPRAAVIAPAPSPEPAPEPEPAYIEDTENETEVAVGLPVAVAVAVPATPARASTVGVPVAGPSDLWRSWALALGAVRGPLPLAAFERLFAESYVPLANAIACGLDDPRATRAYDEFRRTFERAYADAFVTFGVTNRRPRLVMDAYDMASKQARLHNARAAHVLVVDSLRWDLGARVRDAIGAKISGGASLTSESVVWSALPTTTIRQLETLARGIDALRAPSAEDPQDSLRGRSAEVIRRIRVSSRELYKLDLVPAMLSALGDAPGAREVVASLEDVADAVADVLVRHIEALPPRTLLLVLGDHGFTVDRRGSILHGGASPEEVLVPAYAWLSGSGDLH